MLMPCKTKCLHPLSSHENNSDSAAATSAIPLMNGMNFFSYADISKIVIGHNNYFAAIVIAGRLYHSRMLDSIIFSDELIDIEITQNTNQQRMYWYSAIIDLLTATNDSWWDAQQLLSILIERSYTDKIAAEFMLPTYIASITNKFNEAIRFIGDCSNNTIDRVSKKEALHHLENIRLILTSCEAFGLQVSIAASDGIHFYTTYNRGVKTHNYKYNNDLSESKEKINSFYEDSLSSHEFINLPINAVINKNYDNNIEIMIRFGQYIKKIATSIT